MDNNPSSVSLTVIELEEREAGNWNCTIEVENVGTIVHTIEVIVVGKTN